MANIIENPEQLSLFFEYPNGLKRQKPFPLDVNSLFSSTQNAKDYANNNPVAYAGQIITVVEPNESGENETKLFLITDKSGDNVLQGIATGNFVPVSGGTMTGDLTLQMNEIDNGDGTVTKLGGTLYSRMVENSNTITSKILIGTQSVKTPRLMVDTIEKYTSDPLEIKSLTNFISGVHMLESLSVYGTLHTDFIASRTLNGSIICNSICNFYNRVICNGYLVSTQIAEFNRIKGYNGGNLYIGSGIILDSGGEITGNSTSIFVENVSASTSITGNELQVHGSETKLYRKVSGTERLTFYAEKGFEFEATSSYNTTFNMPVSMLNTLNVQGNLYIYGNNNSNSCFIRAETSMSSNFLRMHGGNVELSSQSTLFFRTNQNSTRGTRYSSSYGTSYWEWQFTYAGNTTCPGQVQAVSFYATSDIRKKKNIQLYTPTSSILDIPVKEFDLVDNNEHTIGFIAQELQEKFPILVKEDEQGFLSINENKLVYLLMDEVKKLKEEIKEMKSTYGKC